MKPSVSFLLVLFLTLTQIANTTDSNSESEGAYHEQSRKEPSGVEFSEYSDYGIKHHSTRAMGQSNSPTEIRDDVSSRLGTHSTQHKKHMAKSAIANLKLVPNWPDPNIQLGQVAGVDIDKNGNVVVFHRGDRVWGSQTFTYNNIYTEKVLGPIQQNTVVVVHSSSGLVIKEWGSNMFYLPHGLTVDHENNVWVTDVALHQVFKFSANRSLSDKPSLILGEPFVPGKDNNHFCKPTDVAVLRNGDFFVSDGYCNSRIIKFDKTGNILMEWGRSTIIVSALEDKPPPDHFLVPHALAIDEANSTLFVADRENGRIQCFNTSTGVFIRQLHAIRMGPRIFSVAFAPVQGGLLFIVNGPVLGNTSVKVDGFVVSLTPSETHYTGASFVGYFNTDGIGFQNPHDVAVTRDGNEVYVVELDPFKVWKFEQGNSSMYAPSYTSKTENINSGGDKTTTLMTSHNSKVDTTAAVPTVSPVNMHNSPNKSSIVATIAAIASVITVIIIALTVIILRFHRGASKHYSELEMYDD